MTTTQKSSKGLNIAIWVAQVVLALMFLMAGFVKTTQPIEQLSATMKWTAQVPSGLVRFVGISEFLGALGLLLPSIFRIKPILTPIAAMGIVTIMVFAIIFHISKGETSVIGVNIFIMLLAAFIAWGRFKKVPIQPKG